LIIARLTKYPQWRVLNGEVGMTFIVDHFTRGIRGPIAHLRDYRYPNKWCPFRIWSVPVDCYQVVNEPVAVPGMLQT
jgi:hypothetical protein